MKIAVVGSGFVGTATGKGLGKHSNKITFVDVDPNKVAILKKDGFEAFLPEDYPEITTDLTINHPAASRRGMTGSYKPITT